MTKINFTEQHENALRVANRIILAYLGTETTKKLPVKIGEFPYIGITAEGNIVLKHSYVSVYRVHYITKDSRLLFKTADSIQSGIE